MSCYFIIDIITELCLFKNTCLFINRDQVLKHTLDGMSAVKYFCEVCYLHIYLFSLQVTQPVYKQMAHGLYLYICKRMFFLTDLCVFTQFNELDYCLLLSACGSFCNECDAAGCTDGKCDTKYYKATDKMCKLEWIHCESLPINISIYL